MRYQNKRLVPTRSAYQELEQLGLDLYEATEILEQGYDCQRSKRKAGKIERCLRKGSKVYRIVIADGEFCYPDGSIENVYWIIHISQETHKKGRSKGKGRK